MHSFSGTLSPVYSASTTVLFGGLGSRREKAHGFAALAGCESIHLTVEALNKDPKAPWGAQWEEKFWLNLTTGSHLILELRIHLQKSLR